MLTPEQIKHIKKRYLESNVSPGANYDEAFKQALEYVQLFEAPINLQKLGHPEDEIANDDTEFDKTSLYHYLNTYIIKVENEFHFDAVNAPEYLFALSRQIVDASQLARSQAAHASETLKQKYEAGKSLQAHWLTDNDLEAALEQTGNQNDIKIKSFTKEALSDAINHCFRDNQTKINNGDPVSLPLLLNVRNNHWIAGVITITPATKTLSYQVVDSISGSGKKSEYETLLQTSIELAKSQASQYQVNELTDYSLDTTRCEIIASGEQTDGFSCGYRALHKLFELQPELLKNDSARTYAQTSPQTHDLVEAFCHLVKIPVNSSTLTSVAYKTTQGEPNAHNQPSKRVFNNATVIPQPLDNNAFNNQARANNFSSYALTLLKVIFFPITLIVLGVNALTQATAKQPKLLKDSKSVPLMSAAVDDNIPGSHTIMNKQGLGARIQNPSQNTLHRSQQTTQTTLTNNEQNTTPTNAKPGDTPQTDEEPSNPSNMKP